MKTTLFFLSFCFVAARLSAQNLGVNTPIPLKTFSVNGTIAVDHSNKNFGTLDSASLIFGTPATVGLSSNKSGAGINPQGLDFWSSNQRRMVIGQTGNVGIGVFVPVSKLQINGGTDVSLINHGFLMLGAENGQNLAFDSNEIQARNNGVASTLLMQYNGGNAQIGSPTDENIRFSGVNIQSNYNGASSELVLNGINGGKIRLGGNLDFATTKLHISSGVDAGLGIANSGYMMIGPSNGENVVFDNNEILARNNGVASTLFLARDGSKVQLGNGSEASGTKLHLSTGNDVSLTAPNSGFLLMGATTGVNLAMDNNEIQARNNGAAASLFLQNSGGNVALGNITPITQLHMTGDFTMQSTEPTIQFKNSGGTNIGFLGGTSDDIQIGTFASNDAGNFIIRTNGGNRVYVNPTGQVSIGTATPATGYLLSVKGRAMVEELKVQLSGNWPDYVFSDKYKMKTFDELRSYIAENKHLPNIPAADEIEKSGLEVGEMQRKMMEKIEELTLYVLQLEQKIQELKK